MIIASISFLALVFFLCILFFKYQKQQKALDVHADSSEKSSIISSKICQTVAFVLLLLSGSMEGAFGGYIAVYGVKQLEMTFSTAALLATTFWGCFALGRGLSIFLVQCLKSHIIIYGDWVIVSLSLFSFFMFDHLMPDVMVYFLFAMSILAMILFSFSDFVVIKRCTLGMK